MHQTAAWALIVVSLLAPAWALRRSRLSRAVALAVLPAAAMGTAFALSLATDWGHRADQAGGDVTNAGDLFILAVLLQVAGILGLGSAGLVRLVTQLRALRARRARPQR